MNTRWTATLTPLLIVCLLALCVSCAPGRYRYRGGGDESVTTISTGAKRADPGYIQFLERLSMLGSQGELARVVSGSQIAWLRSAGEPFPEPLLAMADTWLHINPTTMLPESKRSVFASIASPQYWQIFNRARIGGLFIAPAGGAGSLWAYNRTASTFGEDVIQYAFSETAGTEREYFRLLDTANTNKKLLGQEMAPATTGFGPDFFLAARYYRQFSGAYCMIELPQSVWDDLPEVKDQWHGVALSDEETAHLASQSLLPAAMVQDFQPTGKRGGWAVTDKIYGVDGIPRRWAYRYYGSADRPVLNWEDPSSGARRILSGSAIRNVGLLGGALMGVKLDGFYGLDTAPTKGVKGFDPYPGNEAALAVSREVRRYGGWAWLQDDIPLSLTAALMEKGPDFMRDNIFSPGVEHAVLTGSTKLLEAQVNDAIMLGLDMRRFVHATTAEKGVDYNLPHLANVGAGNRTASLLTPAAARKLREQALKEAQTVVFGATFTSSKGDDKIPLSGKLLNTSSAGVASLALGAGIAEAVVAKLLPRVRDGHYIQVFVKAMLPGLFMLSGQDMAGSLPLSWYSMAPNEMEWDVAYAARGAYAFTQSVSVTAATAQGVPRAKTIYETPDAQILDEESFIGKLTELMGIRTTYNVANSRFHGRFETTSPGSFAYALVLPEQEADKEEKASPAAQTPNSQAEEEDEAARKRAERRQKTLAEKRKAEHERNERARKRLHRKIIVAPNTGGGAVADEAALIVVVNFSDKRITEQLNLYHDPVLEDIRKKGDPELLTKERGDIKMTHGAKTVTVHLEPWHAAVVHIGKR